MVITPIKTEQDYEAAMARIEELWGISLEARECDELDVLLALTGAYEKKHHRVEPPNPLALLEYRLDQLGLSEEEVDRFMEARHKLPEILSSESGLSLDTIKTLRDIPFEAFTA
ncbi:MAG: hypothetical protein AB1473_02020 [Thermodesulfobacteriota bacterium]